MAFAGQAIENPATKERVTFRATTQDTGGEYFQMATSLPPGGFVAARHVHPYQRERFEVLEGTARFRLGDIERDAPTGGDSDCTRDLAHVLGSGPGADSRPVRVPAWPRSSAGKGECGGSSTATATAASRTRRSRCRPVAGGR